MKRQNIFLYFLLFLLINASLYLCMIKSLSVFKINKEHYRAAYHYYQDPRIKGGSGLFLRSLGQFDSQWYLRIANLGYPKVESKDPKYSQKNIGARSYSFFPLYPILINFFNRFIHNSELAAFVIANLLMSINFFLIIHCLTKIVGRKQALKTVFLFFLFPFSIFFRSYYTENLSLFFLLLFINFLVDKKYVRSAVALAFLNISRVSFLPAVLVLEYSIFSDKKVKLKKKITIMILGVLISLILVLAWMFFNFIQTGNSIYFTISHQNWYLESFRFPFPLSLFLPYILANLYQIIEFPYLSFHSFGNSQLEVITFFVFSLALIKSKKNLSKELWLISLISFVFPFLTSLLLSFSRYQSMSLPLFIYFANQLKGFSYVLTVIVMYILLLITSALFINWNWIG